MSEKHLYIFETIKAGSLQRLNSGEIIVHCNDLGNLKGDTHQMIDTFLRNSSIHTKPSVFEITGIFKDETLE